jgi:exopolyphosphatase/guanosine-5'-triphosphate,3'-diphosphate pyrophosphatase
VSTLRVSFHDRSASCDVDDVSAALPVGVLTLAELINADPPAPEELTNAIGWLQDHLEDATRELPMAQFAERVELAGPGFDALAAVEVGAIASLPFELTRDAAEDVFRTLVTETAAARLHNPGLPAPQVHTVLGGACAVVAVMRFLRLDAVWLVPSPEAAA